MKDPTIIEAHAFHLKDSKGRTVAKLTTNEDDEAMLLFTNTRDQVRIAVGVTKQREAQFLMFDESGQMRVAIGHMPSGAGHVMLIGDERRVSAGLSMGHDESAGFVGVVGQHTRCHMGIAPDKTPFIQVLNKDGSLVWNAVKRDGGGIILPGMEGFGGG